MCTDAQFHIRSGPTSRVLIRIFGGTKMRRILLIYWLSFLGTSLSMSRHNDCNFMEQVIQHSYDLQICVCSNQVYVNCSLNGANVGTKNLTKKEELCYKSRIKLGDTTEQKTCVCSRINQCHGEEERALLKNACARKAVTKITPIRSQLETLCCDVQRALLKLWFRLEERVFKRLIKSISHDSLGTRMISRRLRRTKWCKSFHSECLEADMSIRKGCKIRPKREIKENRRSYNTEPIPFTKAMTKGLHKHTKQSSIQSTMADTTTTNTQTTRFLGTFATRTWALRSTSTTGDDGKVLSMSGHWPTPPPSSTSSSSLSSILSSSSTSSSSLSSLSSTSPPPRRRKNSQGLISSTLSSSPLHLSQNLSPVQSFVKPSTATSEQINTAELQTTFASSTKMSTSFKDRMTRLIIKRSTLSSSEEISSSQAVVSSTKVTPKTTLKSSVMTTKAQIDYSSSPSYSSIPSSSASLYVEGSLLPSYASPSTSSSSLSPTPRHWALGVTTKMRPETSTSPGMVSSELRVDETTAAFLTEEPSLSNVTREVSPVKEPSSQSLSKTTLLTPSMAKYDEFTTISDSSQIRTSIPMIMSRVASLVSSFYRRISHTRRKPSVTLFKSSSTARRSTTIPDVNIHSKYDMISIPGRESLDLSSKIDITMMVTSPSSVPRSPVIFQETKVSILGSPSTRTRQTYEYSSSNVSRTSSIKVIKRIPKTTVNETSSTSAGLRMAITVSSWKTMTEPTSGLYQPSSSTIPLSSPLSSPSSLTTPLIALPLPTFLSSSASTILLMSTSSSFLSPSLSVTASESSSPFTEQEMPSPSLLEFATSSIQPSKSQIIISTSHLSATSTASVPISLAPKETIRTLVPSPRRTSLLSPSSSSSSSSFPNIFVPESELLSAVSSPILVPLASTTLHVDTSSMHSIAHTSSLRKPLLKPTSVEPTLPLRRASSSSSTTLYNYSIFTKEFAMWKISNSLSSVTLTSVSSTTLEQSTPSLKEYSYVAIPPYFSSMSLLNQTMSVKAPILLPSPPSSSVPKPLTSAPISSTTQPLSSPSLLPSSLSSATPSSTQPLSSPSLLPSLLSSAKPSSTQPLSSPSLLPSLLSSSATPSSTQPLSSPSLLPSSLSSSATASSTQPLSSPSLLPSLLSSAKPSSTQPLSSPSLLPSLLSSSATPSSTQPLSSPSLLPSSLSSSATPSSTQPLSSLSLLPSLLSLPPSTQPLSSPSLLPSSLSSSATPSSTQPLSSPSLLPSSLSSSTQPLSSPSLLPSLLSSAKPSSTQPLSSPSLPSSLSSSATPSSTQPLSSPSLLPSSLSSSATPSSTQPLSSPSLLPSSLSSSATPSSTQPLSSPSLLPSSLSSSATPSSTQPLSSPSLLPSSLSSSATPSSTQPLSSPSLLPSSLSSSAPISSSTKPLSSSPLLPSLLSLPPSSTQPLSTTQPSPPLFSLTVQTLLSPSSQPILLLPSSSLFSSSTSSANRSSEWQSMLQVTKTTSKRLTLSTQNETTELVQNNSTAARRPPVPPLSASSSLSSTPSPTLPLTSHFPSSSVKLFSSQTPVSVFVSSSTELPMLLTPVSSSLKSSPTPLSLPSATSTAHVGVLVLSSSRSFTSLTPVSSSSLTSTPLSSLPSTSFVPFRQLMTSSPSLLPLPLLPTSLSLFLSSTSPMPTSSVSSTSSLSSTPPLSSSLMPSSSLSTSAPIPLSSPLLTTPLLSSSFIRVSTLSSTSISSSLIPSSLKLSMSPTSASTLWPSLPSSVGLLMPSSSVTPGSSIASSLMPTSLKLSMSQTFSSSLIPLLQFSPRSSMVTSSNVGLPKSDNLAKTILLSKTLVVNQPSSPPPSEEPYIKAIFLAVLDGNCLEVTSRESFKSAFIDTLTNLLGLQSDGIDILDIRCGSVKVLFSIIHKQTNKIAEFLDQLVKEDRMNIAFNGKTYRAVSIMSLHPTTARPTALTPSIINPTINVLAAQINERRLIKILFILFVSIFGALALFGIVVCIAKICGRRRYSRLRLKTSTLSSRGTNQIYKNELELIRMSPLHRYADYYGGTNQEPHPKEESDEEANINNRTALLNMLRNGEIASRRGQITVKDDDSYSSIAFY